VEELTPPNNPKDSTRSGQSMEQAYKKARFWLYVNAGLFAAAFFILIGVFWVVTSTTDNIDQAAEDLAGQTQEKQKQGGKTSTGGYVRRAVDGKWVKPEIASSGLTAVVVDNHVDARPASSLSRANLVYEIEAEGGITRYLAVYNQDSQIKEVGPIRSARPYFLDLARELKALFVHVGGSPAALARLAKPDAVTNMNQFYQGDYFWRDSSRERPHNVFTQSSLIRAYKRDIGADNGLPASWKYKKDQPDKERPKDPDPITVGYTFEGHKVKWLYNHAENNYLRYLDGDLHKDKQGNTIKAKNVVVQTVEGEVLDKKLRLRLDMTGQGKAVVCRDGTCRKAGWQKKDKDSRTRYYENGQEVAFNAGTTWVEVVRPHIQVSY